MAIINKLLRSTSVASRWIYKKIKSAKLPIKKNQNKCYKIVETKKQRRNKIIIIRKRVPFEYNPLELNSKKANLGTIFYLTFKEDSNQETKSEAYTIIKDSIWDFPTEKRRRK